jgi:hypothetical protein
MLHAEVLVLDGDLHSGTREESWSQGKKEKKERGFADTHVKLLLNLKYFSALLKSHLLIQSLKKKILSRVYGVIFYG